MLRIRGKLSSQRFSGPSDRLGWLLIRCGGSAMTGAQRNVLQAEEQRRTPIGRREHQ